ncbi:siderophore ABC transporter substrate-binding protein [Intestinibacter bartlettii]|uniref:siderophore ABC transporter substrate-binding protein n=1 Tax=Intestinibacter bartlettii TaxID=261299 RepID=UPI0006C595EB|nr:ABC transporter substrate-binding protein [Intestinibacter bartlettii]MEE0618094.1 ABC transporter substrate-binding protein [Intestinibacter bartlettii]CUO96128.1 ferric siderophore ABC transporter%2Csubstrate-binding protein [Intestinibacter bartlettii]
MNKKAAAIVGGILVLGLGVFGFTKLNSGSQNQQTQQEQSAEQTTVQITDANGEKAELKKNPKRVVVFDYGVADILKNLGVDAVVGLPKNGKMPEILSNYSDDKYTNVGSLKETDFEAVESLNPDLIIIGGRQAEDIDSFKEIAPTVNLAVDGQDYMNSFKTVVTDLGKLFDKEDEAKKAIDEIEAKIEKVNKTVKEKGLTASVVMANEGNISAFSAKSRYGLIYNGLGFAEVDKNIDDSTHGQQVSFEYFLENKSDYVFVVDRGAVTGKGEAASKLFDNEVMNKTEVAKNGNIVYLNSVIWYTMTGGIESTNQMIDEIADAVK